MRVENLNKSVTLRVVDRDWKRIVRMAKAAKKRPSAFIRQIIAAEIAKNGEGAQ